MEKGDKDVLLKLKEDYNNNLISALIGAGFSKNISSSFPNWSELLHDMIDDLYSVDIKRYYNNYLHLNKDTNCTLKSEKEIHDEYISEIGEKNNFLEIVSEYIERKGIRESVESYIEERIPYSEIDHDGRIVLKIGNKTLETISEECFLAHKELLRLTRLQNIYTTNYENLLEFTKELLNKDNIAELPDLVLSAHDLSNRIHRRNIIKLHGNLRISEKDSFGFDGDNKICYVIAKEDYNSYYKIANLLTKLKKKEIIDRKARSKHDSRVVKNGNLLRTELLRRKTLYLDERTKHYLHIMTLHNVEVRRIGRSRFRLGNQNLLYHRLS